MIRISIFNDSAQGGWFTVAETNSQAVADSIATRYRNKGYSVSCEPLGKGYEPAIIANHPQSAATAFKAQPADSTTRALHKLAGWEKPD